MKSNNVDNRIKIRRSSGETQYVTSAELKKINKRRGERSKELKSLRMQRNVAVIVTIVAVLSASFFAFKEPELLEVTVQTGVSIGSSTGSESSELIIAKKAKSVSSIEGLSIRNPIILSPIASKMILEEQENMVIKRHLESVVVLDVVQSTDTIGPTVIIAANKPEEALLSWAASWSAQNVARYLSYYSDSFEPSNGLQRQQWRHQREVRLVKPQWIKIELSEIDIVILEEVMVEVRFTQAFSSDGFSDVSKKLIVMGLEQGYWKILKEDSI